jgi:hypothetical protein
MTWFFLSSELYIKDTHANGVTQLDLLTVKIMGRKQKLSRVFGRALGRHRKIERQKHVGRPIYQVKHSRKKEK